MGSAKPRLLLLGRPGCHLCEEFVEELQAAFPGAVDVTEACVDDRTDWRERFGPRIPVLLDDAGAPVCETFFERRNFETWLAQQRKAQLP